MKMFGFQNKNADIVKKYASVSRSAFIIENNRYPMTLLLLKIVVFFSVYFALD